MTQFDPSIPVERFIVPLPIRESDISPLANLKNFRMLSLSDCPLVNGDENIQALKRLNENGCEIFGVEELMT